MDAHWPDSEIPVADWLKMEFWIFDENWLFTSLKYNLYALKGEERVELSILVLGAHGGKFEISFWEDTWDFLTWCDS